MFHRYRPLKSSAKESKITENREIEPDIESNCSSAESDNLEDIYQERPSFENYEYPDDYWRFLKSVKYLQYGRPVITALALLTSIECDFQDPVMLKLLKDYRMLEILLNFLKSSDKRIQTISIRFLKKLSTIRVLRQEIVHLGGVKSLSNILKEAEVDLKQAAAETMTVVADFHKAWEAVRLAGGIPLLVNLIYVPKLLLFEQPQVLSEQLTGVLGAAVAAAETLFVVCECKKNQMEFLLSGALHACQNILKTNHVNLCTTVLQIIQRCAGQKSVRLAIRNSNMLEDFRIHFYSSDQKLMQSAALAAFTCAEGAEESKQFFGKAGFVDKIYEIIQTSSFHNDYELMTAISGALWKSAENEENLKRLQALNAPQLLIQLLTSQPVKVLENLVACLSCCMSNQQMLIAIRKNNGIEPLIELLHTTHPPLIMHLNKALAAASYDNESMAIMEKYDSLRLIWSHLKHEDSSVVANTAWQLTVIIQNMDKSSQYIRSLVGGIQVLMECLNTTHSRVLTAVCALIVVLCKEKENVRALTDYKVVDSLSKLVGTKCRRLRYHVCMAITAICPFGNNREEFANRRVVFPLILMLKSKTPLVVGAATRALHQLAYIPKWCAIMYNNSGVYEIFIKQMKSQDREVQEAAAGIIQKMRIFALNRDGYIPQWLIEKHSTFFWGKK